MNQVEQNIARLAMVVLRALPFGGAILDRAYSRQMLIYFFIKFIRAYKFYHEISCCLIFHLPKRDG